MDVVSCLRLACVSVNSDGRQKTLCYRDAWLRDSRAALQSFSMRHPSTIRHIDSNDPLTGSDVSSIIGSSPKPLTTTMCSSLLLFMLWRFGNREAKRRGSRAFFANQSELKSRLEQPYFRERAKNG